MCVVCFYCYLIVFLLFDNNSVYTKLFPRNRIYSTVIVIVSLDCVCVGAIAGFAPLVPQARVITGTGNNLYMVLFQFAII